MDKIRAVETLEFVPRPTPTLIIDKKSCLGLPHSVLSFALPTKSRASGAVGGGGGGQNNPPDQCEAVPILYSPPSLENKRSYYE